jgi:uncharacterized protein
VRLATGAAAASVALPTTAGPEITVTARAVGTAGNGLRLVVDHDTTVPDRFNLRVIDPAGTSETHRNLSVTKGSPDSVEQLDTASGLVSVELAGDGTALPRPSGTVSQSLTGALPDPARTLTAAIGTDRYPFVLHDPEADGPPPADLADLARLLQAKLRAISEPRRTGALSRAEVRAVGDRLHVLPGEPDTTVRFVDDTGDGLSWEPSQPSTLALASGTDAAAPTVADFVGSADAKTGIHALRDVADVNILALPEIADRPLDEHMAVVAEAERLCRERRIFLLVDPPAAWDSLDAAQLGLARGGLVRSDHAALYFPRLVLTDTVTGQLRTFAPSGAVAGIMARTDSERGVWKAPAGTDARLGGVRALTVPLTDPENGLLNPKGVNCLRTFPLVGPVVWGARTLDGADALASQWKYVPVRRLALMIEESLYRGTQWVVFEPNDERLWGQIRLNVGAFMQSLFRQGAFQGTAARDAYVVKCDKDTTTQNDINRGVVNIVVGFAPLKPAEFVIIQIEQLAGQVEV